MNWLSALRLRDAGWLSFDPETVPELTASQEAELCFMGTLVAAGCDEIMLPRLLSSLRKPYAYRIDVMYYNWQEQSWQVSLTDTDFRDKFNSWIDSLEDSAELKKLEDLRGRVEHSIREVRSWRTW